MIRVLIADNNPDSHELIDDLIEINFRDVQIDHALTGQAFIDKINSEALPYNLVVFNFELDGVEGESVLAAIKNKHAFLFERMVILAAEETDVSSVPKAAAVVKSPFSLDDFGDVVRKHCVEE